MAKCFRASGRARYSSVQHTSTDSCSSSVSLHVLLRYDLFSDDYDTSEKCRAPAYTDRVLFRRRLPGGHTEADGENDGQIVSYRRAELKVSDHRPILAVFDVKARSVRPGDRERTLEEVLRSAPSCDGRLRLTPVSHRPASWQEQQESLGNALAELGETSLYTQLRRGEVMVQFSSVTDAGKLEGKQLQTSLGAWNVSVLDQNLNVEKLVKDEMSMFSNRNISKSESKKPPPRPSAPPPRPSAPPSARPSRPAPAPPTAMETAVARTERLELEDSDEEVGWPQHEIKQPVLAPLDWPEDPPNVNLASLDWPEESSQPPAEAPPSPPCPDLPPSFDPPSLDESLGPPPFSPPVLSQPPRGPPPRLPDRGPPPPVPRR